MADRVLSSRELNRALLARQLLLERADLSIETAVAQAGCLQTQYTPSGYIGLWARMGPFERQELTDELRARTVVQATLMRVTIHLSAAREFWRYAMGVREARRRWWLRIHRGEVTESDMERGADQLRAALSDGPRSVKELGALVSGFLGNRGLWVDLVRVPPSGTWEHRRADLLALAEDWIGPCDASEDEGLEHLVRAYLRGFGPAPMRDISSWAGVPVSLLQRGAERAELVRYRDETGRELFDLPGAPLPHADTPAPVRFLPHWDANLLVHARRAGLLPEEHRPRVFSVRNPFSVGVYLVDGRVRGGWTVKDGRVVLDPYESSEGAVLREVEEERRRLEAFNA